ncbi:hypothetical protein BHS09_27100 [Myxococcus xanthus]|uniref:Uncharacterized protein n=1 Tax=Myxococcus xanthus TaxID=34 RepID=A0AAE6KUF5_MYXXA|nr:hypothetical protein [Myxococcus xanthus]QDE70342.1 hypothetical protein BHS09_27100 [Myxococcus xanthus]QDE77621.1 hypothetical protein BHS08_27120 [Myxococcus xanthus]
MSLPGAALSRHLASRLYSVKVPPESHFVAFDVNGAYENGALTGHGYATYCPSLDSFKSKRK